MDSEDSSDMKTQPLINVFRQALKTFSPKSDVDFLSNFKKLKDALDLIRADHVRLDPAFDDEFLWVTGEKAPCTYIEIFENRNMNMSIFILKPGFKMPLHDHPQMHGLLKVLSGNVRIKSFSEIQLTEACRDLSQAGDSEINNSPTKSRYDRLFFAKVTDERICNSESECCILTPTESNFHEIEAIGVPSAFLDILAPPYSTAIKESEPRECHYYKVNQEISTNVVQFQEIPSPKWFYCDQSPYLGPVLTEAVS